MKKRYWIILSVVLCLIIAIGALGFYSEYLEVREIGEDYTKVFFTDILARFEMIGILFVVLFIIALVNLLVVRKNIERISINVPVFLKRKFVFLASGVIALFGAVFMQEGLYRKFLLCTNAVEAGIKDPVFNLDLSYFFFVRDFLQSGAAVICGAVVVMAAMSIALYYLCLTEGDVLKIKSVISDRGVFLHIAVVAIVLCVLQGLKYYLEAQGLVLSQSGAAPGAGYTDILIKLPFYTFAPYILFVIAAVAAFLLYKRRVKGTVITILVFPVMIVVVSLVQAGVDFFYVRPNEATLEAKYIENNIEYTKIGFKLDGVVEREFPATQTLTRDIINNNSEIINNIRITDPQATGEVLNSTKSIRNYYVFNDSDIVEYDIGGKPTAVNISARELDITLLDPKANNYINRTFKYTHGYGINMNAVNSVNSEGQPDFVIGDMPIASEEGAPIVTEPRIYYGEKTNNYCIVNTDINEIDYPLNDGNVEENYKGTKSGIEMNTLNRLVFAVKNMDYTMLVSGYINSDSRLLTNRNVLERVKKAVPFMEVDPDPYIVIDSYGKLKWVVDLYTTSNQMPYGTLYNNISYIRNSAKAVVDAYEGTVEVYITDESDAIVMTYDKIYPGVLKKGGLPEDINPHIRYPEYLFNMQSNVYLRYHMDDAEMFYTNSDLWMKAKEKYRGTDAVDVVPYYNLLSVEDFGREGAQLVLMMPFVPANKENLVSWLAADSYGNMISYRFPAGRTVYGTLHIENRIDADADISKELSLWNQGGSTVLRGNVLVIPIADSIIYVEPVYITTSNQAAVPEVKRIIMAYGDRVVMRETLDECFDALFGKGSENPDAETEENNPEVEITPEDVEDAKDYAREALEAYDNVQKAWQNGDWAAFGMAMEELDIAMNNLRGE